VVVACICIWTKEWIKHIFFLLTLCHLQTMCLLCCSLN
jgi:hypothetical protein